MSKMCYCDLCGTALPRTEYLYEIVDTRDRYKRYHRKYWNVCDECHEELEARRKKVLDELINSQINKPSGDCCKECDCEIDWIELD